MKGIYKDPYSVAKRNDFIDWNARLAQKKITKTEWLQWTEEAASYVTCACGNLCKSIPRSKHDAAPIDDMLALEGAFFWAAITREEVENARKILRKIEARAAVLLRKINARKKK